MNLTLFPPASENLAFARLLSELGIFIPKRLTLGFRPYMQETLYRLQTFLSGDGERKVKLLPFHGLRLCGYRMNAVSVSQGGRAWNFVESNFRSLKPHEINNGISHL